MKFQCAFVLVCACFATCAQTSDTLRPRNALIYSPTVKYAPLLEKPDAKANVVASAHRADSVDVLEYTGGAYCKVRIPPGQLETDGYLPIDLFKYDSVMVLFINAFNKAVGNSTRLTYERPPQFIRDRVATAATAYTAPSPGSANSAKSTISNSSYSGTSSSSSHTIQTGPRGGQYYINKNGKKTYVKKK